MPLGKDILPPDEHVYKRLQDANEHLTLAALKAQDQAEELAHCYGLQSQLNAELERKHEKLRSLACELTLAEHRERKRLAEELHDYLAQMMVLGRMRIAQMRQKLSPTDPKLVKAMADLDDIFAKSLAYSRTLMAQLSPPVLYELGLSAALKWLAGQMKINHGLAVDLDVSPAHVAVPDDHALLLYQSVRELLLNVIKHAGTHQATLRLAVTHDARLKIMVQDAGQGSSLPLLEAKMTTEHFGLFTIRERMEVMGGSLHADSTMGGGTTVTLYLPLRSALVRQLPSPAAMQPSGASHVVRRAAAGEHRLLLVDDHTMVRQGLRAILEDYYDLSVVGEAANGVEAVRMTAQIVPDVVIMDINMPQMDGIEATRRIKDAHPAIMVIGLSVNTSPQVIDAMTLAGAAAFVPKDAAAEQLHAVIQALFPPEPRPRSETPAA